MPLLGRTGRGPTKINVRVQTFIFLFSVFTMGRQELCAKRQKTPKLTQNTQNFDKV